jgi:predicted nucleotidyltransferase
MSANTRGRSKITGLSAEKIGHLLAEYCHQQGITCLEIFGSVARDGTKRGSDVDILATFAENPGLAFFSMEEDMAEILGLPVHLLTRDGVETMSNPYIRTTILAEARVIYSRQEVQS